jgi:hypothetical protein
LHIPLFFLAAPLTGRILGKVRLPKFSAAVALILIVCCLPWILFNKTKHLVGANDVFHTSREAQYYMLQKNPGFKRAATFIQSTGCSQIGVRFTWWNETEYLFWIHFQNDRSNPVRIQHVNVENDSARLSNITPFNQFQPCAVFLMDYSRQLPDQIVVHQTTLRTHPAFQGKAARVLVP